MRPLEIFLERLPGPKRRRGQQIQAHCPAHQDKTPSLSIRETSDGTVLIKCFAGCDARAITAALGLTLRDLFPNKAVR
jgi:DNA primase